MLGKKKREDEGTPGTRERESKHKNGESIKDKATAGLRGRSPLKVNKYNDIKYQICSGILGKGRRNKVGTRTGQRCN